MLAPHHQQILKDRAISDDVAALRGYRTISDANELALAGFAPKQARLDVPGMLIPRYGLDSKPASHPKFRPDRARLRADGTPVKYDSPVGSWGVLDALPGSSLFCDNELWVSAEGFLKADSMSSAGVTAVAFDGVWGWRTQGAALQGFATLARWPRWWHVVCDNDFATSSDVPVAVCQLGQHLKQLGGKVRILHPPANGHKVGVDDWLAGGGSLDGLVQVTTAEAAEVLRRRPQRPRAYSQQIEEEVA